MRPWRDEWRPDWGRGFDPLNQGHQFRVIANGLKIGRSQPVSGLLRELFIMFVVDQDRLRPALAM